MDKKLRASPREERKTDMKITNIYKTTAALIFLMAAALWPAVDALGQVTGDKYRIKLNPDVANIKARTEDNQPAGDDENEGKTYYINAAFDGNNTTWWMSSKPGKHINIYIPFDSEQTIQSLHFLRAESESRREQSVQVYILSSDKEIDWNNPSNSEWKLVETFENNTANLENRDYDYYLTDSITTKYLRLRLENQGNNEPLVVNEITIYDSSDKYSSQRIKHKLAKWHNLRGSNTNASTGDTFSRDEEWFTPQDNPFISNYPDDGQQIQAAHTYIDTIYMHPGKSVTLTLAESPVTPT